MKKKIKFLMISLFATFAFMPNVLASGEEAMIGTDYYGTLEEAYTAAVDGDTIVLQEDVVLEDTLVVSKDITINLNNHSIEKDSNVINVDGGSLVLSGTGTIKETAPDNAGVKLYGSTDSSVTDYSYLSVGEDVTIEAWSPVFISVKNSKAYGVKVDVYGALIGKRDLANAEAGGLYVNGQIKDKTNYPVINVYDNAKIDSDGVGLFLEGYSKVTVGKATITSTASGVAIKSGILTLNGTIVKATGAYENPSDNSNGVNAVGAAIQIESNDSYAGGIEININGGSYESVNNSAIVEYLASTKTETDVEKIAITDGKFKAAEGKDVIIVSDEFKLDNTKFITGGTYSSSVKEFLVAGLTEGNKDNNYQVVDPTEVSEDTNDGEEAEKEEEPKKDETKNPDTADINIVALIFVLVSGVIGLGLTLRKRKFN